MNIQPKFERLIRKYRKELLQAGYKPSRLTMWAQSKRHPSKDEAEKLAPIIGIPVEEIPWVQWVRNE
ncbi:MAG: hypothetical protein WC248_06700 [Candidatus Methanomethylophilaceae archaeon]